ncbi:6988_t:CDS:2, partial [Gigaspora rosea]
DKKHVLNLMGSIFISQYTVEMELLEFQYQSGEFLSTGFTASEVGAYTISELRKHAMLNRYRALPLENQLFIVYDLLRTN